MKNYKLKPQENILFRGNAILYSNFKRIDDECVKNCDITLTNINIILSYPKKRLFKTITKSSVFKVTDVKIYDDTIQIIRQQTSVDVYLKKTELYLTFDEEKTAKDFCNKALTLISGDSQILRAIKKAQKVLNKTAETMADGVTEVTKTAKNVVDTVVNTVANAKDVLISGNDDDIPRIK